MVLSTLFANALYNIPINGITEQKVPMKTRAIERGHMQKRSLFGSRLRNKPPLYILHIIFGALAQLVRAPR